MTDFTYVAVDQTGKTCRGQLREADQIHAIARVKEMGLFPTQLSSSPTKPTSSKGYRCENRPENVSWWRRRRLSSRHLADFTRELATLIESGIPLVRGLRAVARQEKNHSFKVALHQIAYDIEGGSQFSEALQNQPKLFKALYVNMCAAGEQSGALDTTLTRLADLLERTERLKGKVKAAMFYPIAVLVVSVCIMALLMIWIIPQFELIFADLSGGRPLPDFTLFVLGISRTVRDHALWLVGLGMSVLFVTRWACKFRGFRFRVDGVKLQLPILGTLFQFVVLTRFCRTLSTLLQSGVPVLQALTIVKETTGNTVLAHAVDKIYVAVKEGESFTPVMDGLKIFPSTLVSMVDVGEQTGALPSLLSKAADKYADRVDNAVAGLTSLIEPVMIVFLAVIVGSIVIAMFLPLIQIMQFGFDSQGGGDSSRQP